MTVPASYTATAAIYRKLPYRPIDDFTMIGTTVEYPIVLATYVEVAAVLSEPAVVEQLRRLGNNPHPSSPSEFKASMAAGILRWSKLVTEANIERI
jgi:tripartite-type tricarboxylate transporter receptor subunit TctC